MNEPIYVPPSDKTIEEYVKAVCQEYAQQRNEPKIDSPEVRNGFAAFLKVIMRIEANLRNQSSS